MDPIRDLLHRYADAVCRNDELAWAATWSDDGVWDLGGGREATGLEEITDMWRGGMGRYARVLHRYENSAATLDEAAGTGTGRAYVTEVLKPTDEGALVMHGYYDDEYRRTGDGWRFSRRTLVRLYHGPPDFSGFFD